MKQQRYLFKVLALIMLFVGGIAQPSFVWDLGDLGIALMTVFNMMALLPMGGQAIRALNDYNNIRRKTCRKADITREADIT